MRGSWRLNKDCNILTSPAPPGIAVCHSRSPGLLNRGPGAQPLWDMFSSQHLLINWSPNSIRGPKGPFCRVVAFSTTPCLHSSDLQLTDFTELYNSSIAHSISILMASQAGICHFRRLWTGMFDHHQAEITVMQFRGHSLPVHQSMSVPWDFYLVPFFQPSSPTRFLLITAIGMCHFLPVHHLGMACLAGSKVNIQHTLKTDVLILLLL